MNEYLLALFGGSLIGNLGLLGGNDHGNFAGPCRWWRGSAPQSLY
jgi:hypothetical protein